MNNTRINMEMMICDVILGMDRPFKVSQLLAETDKRGIINKDLVLEILSQLCESGLIKYSEIDDDVWAYRKSPQFA